MRSFFRKKSSREVAKDRLKILLISDRVNCSPEMMELIKTDIAKVISKYMKIDTGNMDIQISKMGNQGKRGMRNPVLSASIPILDLNKNT
ncbi:MAG: cell division topological specificity factor MinE [Acetatifactor sp.]